MIDKRTRLTGNLQFKTQRSGSSVEIDGKTIIKDEEGKLRTTVGGFIDDAGNIHKIDSRFILTDKDVILENAKSTGGIGWTDSTPQTITVEWDGNTAGRTVATIEGEPFVYKISDRTPSIADLANSKITLNDGTEHIIEEGALVNLGGIIAEADGDYFFIATKDGATLEGVTTFPEKGIYSFCNTDPLLFVSEFSWSVTETVYKINQKYLPDKDDCIYVTLTPTEQVSEYVTRATANKTYNEIMSEVMKGKTNLFMTIGDGGAGLLTFSNYLGEDGIVFTGLMHNYLYLVICDYSDEWTLGIQRINIPALAYASRYDGLGWVETGVERISWDGDKTGKTAIGSAIDNNGNAGTYYRVSDLTPTDTDLTYPNKADRVSFPNLSDNRDGDLSLENYNNIYTQYGMVTNDFSMFGPCVIVIRTANTTIDPATIRASMGEGSSYLSYLWLQEAATFPETGVYFFCSTRFGNHYVSYIECNNIDTVHKIDPKYLPGNIDVDLTGYAKTSDLPTKTSQLINDSGFLTLADLPVYNGEM